MACCTGVARTTLFKAEAYELRDQILEGFCMFSIRLSRQTWVPEVELLVCAELQAELEDEEEEADELGDPDQDDDRL